MADDRSYTRWRVSYSDKPGLNYPRFREFQVKAEAEAEAFIFSERRNHPNHTVRRWWRVQEEWTEVPLPPWRTLDELT